MDLLTNNALGPAVILRPAGVTRTGSNFITVYDYLTQFMPHLLPELHYANGKGSITGMLSFISEEGTYASDQVKHAEINRLHNRLTNVTYVGNTFTSPTPHNVQPNMVVLISDGVKRYQAYVDSVTSPTVFVALSKKVAGFDFQSATVDISVDFSNTWDKGTGTFVSGNTWTPKFYENQTQIIKWRYDVAESDMAADIWLDTPNGPMWCNTEIERSNQLFENIIELTHFFSDQTEVGSAAQIAGSPVGMKCVVQQVEERGNLANGYIETIEDLQDMALRLVEQGVDQDQIVVLCDLQQMNKFNALCAGVNSAFVNGTNYGSFTNGEEMALKLDFTRIMVSGKQFWFKHWKALNDPTILATGKFDTTGLTYLAFPMGKTQVKAEDGSVSKQGYLKILNRVKGGVNRKRKIQIFGEGGTPQLDDKMTISYTNESTNQLVGANAWFVGQKGTGYTFG